MTFWGFDCGTETEKLKRECFEQCLAVKAWLGSGRYLTGMEVSP